MSASSQSLGLAESQDLPNSIASYKLEDPACAWIDLVEAARLPDPKERRKCVNKLVFLAKNSHWTMDRWIEFADGYTSPEESPSDAFDEHDPMCECAHCTARKDEAQVTLARNMALPPIPTRSPDSVVQIRTRSMLGAENVPRMN